MVTHQRISPAGKLDTDLVAAARMQPHPDQGPLPCGQAGEFQPGRLHACTLLIDHEYLILPTVLKQQILPIAGFRWCTVDHSHVLLDHAPLLDLPGKARSSLLGAGIDHDAAYIFIQPVQGIDLVPQQCRHFMFRVNPHRFDTDHDLRIRI